jgi:hypothetical protein
LFLEFNISCHFLQLRMSGVRPHALFSSSRNSLPTNLKAERTLLRRVSSFRQPQLHFKRKHVRHRYFAMKPDVGRSSPHASSSTSPTQRAAHQPPDLPFPILSFESRYTSPQPQNFNPPTGRQHRSNSNDSEKAPLCNSSGDDTSTASCYGVFGA